MNKIINWFKQLLGLDQIDYRLRRLERTKYWKEKYK